MNAMEKSKNKRKETRILAMKHQRDNNAEGEDSWFMLSWSKFRVKSQTNEGIFNFETFL